MRKAIAQIKKKIEKPLRDAGVVRAGIFGSYARGEQTKNSDIDILIEVKGRKFSLLDLVGLENKIHKILKKKIDLLPYGAINKYLKEKILSEEVQIL